MSAGIQEPFQLQDEPGPAIQHRHHPTFRPSSMAQRVRQVIWTRLKSESRQITLSDLARDLEEFPRTTVYRAARHLVTHGFAERSWSTWAELRNGREVTKRRITLKFVPEFTDTSRKW